MRTRKFEGEKANGSWRSYVRYIHSYYTRDKTLVTFPRLPAPIDGIACSDIGIAKSGVVPGPWMTISGVAFRCGW